MSETSDKNSELNLGQLAASKRLITSEVLTECEAALAEALQAGREITLGEVLVERGHLTANQVRKLSEALTFKKAQKDDTAFGKLAVKLQIVDMELVTECLTTGRKAFVRREPVPRVRNMLIERGAISPEQADQIEQKIEELTGEPISVPLDVALSKVEGPPSDVTPDQEQPPVPETSEEFDEDEAVIAERRFDTPEPDAPFIHEDTPVSAEEEVVDSPIEMGAIEPEPDIVPTPTTLDESVGEGESEWFVVFDGNQVGPLAREEVGRFIVTKSCTEDDIAWKDGMAGWRPIAEIEELSVFIPLMVDAPEVVEETVVCVYCGRRNKPDVIHCVGCGRAIEEQITPATISFSGAVNYEEIPTPATISYSMDEIPTPATIQFNESRTPMSLDHPDRRHHRRRPEGHAPLAPDQVISWHHVLVFVGFLAATFGMVSPFLKFGFSQLSGIDVRNGTVMLLVAFLGLIFSVQNLSRGKHKRSLITLFVAVLAGMIGYVTFDYLQLRGVSYLKELSEGYEPEGKFAVENIFAYGVYLFAGGTVVAAIFSIPGAIREIISRKLSSVFIVILLVLLGYCVTSFVRGKHYDFVLQQQLRAAGYKNIEVEPIDIHKKDEKHHPSDYLHFQITATGNGVKHSTGKDGIWIRIGSISDLRTIKWFAPEEKDNKKPDQKPR